MRTIQRGGRKGVGVTQARVLLVGTDPNDPRGGIGFAIQGYARALESQGLLADFIPSYTPHSSLRFILPMAKAAPKLIAAIRRLKRQGVEPVVYCHAGGRLSIARGAALFNHRARRAGARTMIQLHSTDVGAIIRIRCNAIYFSGPYGRWTACVCCSLLGTPSPRNRRT